MGEDQGDRANEEGEDERPGTCQHSGGSKSEMGEDERQSTQEEVHCCRESEIGRAGESQMGQGESRREEQVVIAFLRASVGAD